MKISFPFIINQVSDTDIEIITSIEGCPLFSLTLAHDVEKALSSDQLEKVYNATMKALVLETMKIS